MTKKDELQNILDDFMARIEAALEQANIERPQQFKNLEFWGGTLPPVAPPHQHDSPPIYQCRTTHVLAECLVCAQKQNNRPSAQQLKDDLDWLNESYE